MMRSVYAFDVDETLEISGGPVPLALMKALKREGHIVGICGNWYLFVREVGDWPQFVSFIGPTNGVDKPTFLKEIKAFIEGEYHILVGNEPKDLVAAQAAGWGFVPEQAYADVFRDKCAQ
jgi:hypothetical protein